jgi:hypothetical protein
MGELYRTFASVVNRPYVVIVAVVGLAMSSKGPSPPTPKGRGDMIADR